jgi:peptidoglycan L-alanyl-D-glutamate endopeptidase CwlK
VKATNSAPLWPWLVGGGLALLVVGSSSSTSNIGGPDKNGISRDPSLLLPAFAAKLAELFRRLRALGFDPLLYEGYRTPERAMMLAEKGSGTIDTLHTYGAAADIVSQSKLWDHPQFFQALGREAEALGMTWGGRFKSRVDMPHVQAVSAIDEGRLRALAPSQRNAFVASRLA